MLRRLQSLLVLTGVCIVSLPALAATDQPDTDGAPVDAPAPRRTKRKKTTEEAVDAQSANEAPTEAPAARDTRAVEEPTPPPPAPLPPASPPPAVEKAEGLTEGWHAELHGYFRAPMTLAFSSRPGPDNMNGPRSTQISYGPNRIVDSSYYSFAYTRLQEQDWAEITVHAKKKHVDAAVGWMGYWYQGVGFRNPDAAWAPALAYLTLESDVEVGAIKPNVAFTMGAFWPKYGYFEKYDTYTLGRFRQIGEELNVTVPVNPDLSLVLTEGFGSGRDGSFDTGINPPIYGAHTALDLVTWENVKLSYQNVFDASLHYNTEWTADPNLTQGGMPSDKSYGVVKQAHLTVFGAEFNVRLPRAGHLWLSPSFIHARNAWALNNAGTEVLHSLGGNGIATNYLMWGNNPTDSTGSGTVTNVGFMYENSLSNINGQELGSVLPDLSLSVFGLLSKAKSDLPSTTTFTQNSLTQFKYGAEVTLQATTWFGFMLRWDFVNMDKDHDGYVFAAITPRMIFSSHFLSGERIYLQYSRYKYGDNMTLAGSWPWGVPIVAGSTVQQQGPYLGSTPDRNIVKLQAEIAF